MRKRPFLRFNESVPDRIADQLGNRRITELAHNSAAVRFDCLYADFQGRSDFLIRLSISEESNDLAFTIRQTDFVIRSVPRPEQLVQQSFCGLRAEVR